MIKNDKQYQVTQKRVAEFEQALTNLKQRKDIDPEEIAIRAGFLEGQLEVLREELDEFDLLRSQKVAWLSMRNVQDLSDVLIKARVAKGWTQDDLAEKLGLKEQQIQRYESTDYETASLARIQLIFMALGLEMNNCRITLGKPSFMFPAEVRPTLYASARDRLLTHKALIEIKNEAA